MLPFSSWATMMPSAFPPPQLGVSSPATGAKPGGGTPAADGENPFDAALAVALQASEGASGVSGSGNGATMAGSGPIARGVESSAALPSPVAAATQVSTPVLTVPPPAKPVDALPVVPAPEIAAVAKPTGVATPAPAVVKVASLTAVPVKLEKAAKSKDDESSDPAPGAGATDWTQIAPQPVPVPLPEPMVAADPQRAVAPEVPVTTMPLQVAASGAPVAPVVVPAAPATHMPEPTVLPSGTMETGGTEDREAFSLRLKPTQAEAPAVKAAMSSPAVLPLSPAPSIAQQNREPETVRREKLSATNPPPPAPPVIGLSSGSGKMSSANAGAEREDQEASPPPQPIHGDANDHTQGFSEFAPSAAPVMPGRETKTVAAPPESPAPVLTQPTTDSTGPATGGAAKEVAIRLQNPSGETVNVKLVDQGGQVQVTVRSSNPEAATALRQDLSSLTGSLEKAGWKLDPPVGTSNPLELLQSTRQTGNDTQDAPGQRTLEWQQQDSPKKRQTTADAWDELLMNQSA